MTIQTTGDPGGDTALKLYGPDSATGTPIGQNDDTPTSRYAEIDRLGGGAPEEFWTDAALRPGTYYVQIYSPTLIVGNQVLKLPHAIAHYAVSVNATPAIHLLKLGVGEATIQNVDPGQRTWVVIHGRDSSSNDMLPLALSINPNLNAADQVLLVDWGPLAKPAGLAPVSLNGKNLSLNEENWIPYVAQWTAARLAAYGFGGRNRLNLNFIGHSWGSYVAAETAHLLRGVNTVVALDPPHPSPSPVDFSSGHYDPDHSPSFDRGPVNFKAVARYSWAFYSSILGDPGTAGTASEAFRVDDLGWNSIQAHTRVVAMFSSMLNVYNGGPANNIQQLFSLDQLLQHAEDPSLGNGNDHPWLPNQFGEWFNGPVQLGLKEFEAVITADEVTGNIKAVTFVTKSGAHQQLNFCWSTGDPVSDPNSC